MYYPYSRTIISVSKGDFLLTVGTASKHEIKDFLS